MSVSRRFLEDESGAVTVDWVILTAGVVVLAITVMPPIQSAVVNMAVLIGNHLGIASGWLESVPN